jgi:hypothetical protein
VRTIPLRLLNLAGWPLVLFCLSCGDTKSSASKLQEAVRASNPGLELVVFSWSGTTLSTVARKALPKETLGLPTSTTEWRLERMPIGISPGRIYREKGTFALRWPRNDDVRMLVLLAPAYTLPTLDRRRSAAAGDEAVIEIARAPWGAP